MSHAIVITPDMEYKSIEFPLLPEDQYRLASANVRSGHPTDHGQVEHAVLAMNGRVFYLLLNEEGMMRRLTYNGLTTMLYLDSLPGNMKRTPIIVGNALIVGRTGRGMWRGLTDEEVTGLMAYLDQLSADIKGARDSVLEELEWPSA